MVSTTAMTNTADLGVQTTTDYLNLDPLFVRLMALSDVDTDLGRPSRAQLCQKLCFLIRNKYRQNLPSLDDFNFVLVQTEAPGGKYRMDLVLEGQVIMFDMYVSSSKHALKWLGVRVSKRCAEVTLENSGPARDKREMARKLAEVEQKSAGVMRSSSQAKEKNATDRAAGNTDSGTEDVKGLLSEPTMQRAGAKKHRLVSKTKQGGLPILLSDKNATWEPTEQSTPVQNHLAIDSDQGSEEGEILQRTKSASNSGKKRKAADRHDAPRKKVKGEEMRDDEKTLNGMTSEEVEHTVTGSIENRGAEVVADAGVKTRDDGDRLVTQVNREY